MPSLGTTMIPCITLDDRIVIILGRTVCGRRPLGWPFQTVFFAKQEAAYPAAILLPCLPVFFQEHPLRLRSHLESGAIFGKKLETSSGAKGLLHWPIRVDSMHPELASPLRSTFDRCVPTTSRPSVTPWHVSRDGRFPLLCSLATSSTTSTVKSTTFLHSGTVRHGLVRSTTRTRSSRVWVKRVEA